MLPKNLVRAGSAVALSLVISGCKHNNTIDCNDPANQDLDECYSDDLYSETPSADPNSCYGFQGVCPKYPGPYIPTEQDPSPWPIDYDYTNQNFPSDFLWGLGTAAYQVEGAYNQEGRGATIWDTFTGANTRDMPGANVTNCPGESGPCNINPHMTNRVAYPAISTPEPSIQGNTGNVAVNQYNDIENQVGLFKKMGMPYYRFSIAWSRICPTGTCCTPEERIQYGGASEKCKGVNQQGIDHYEKEMKALKANGIDPLVTLYHWDLPQGLQNDHDGWYAVKEDGKTPKGLTSTTVQQFEDYAVIVFKNLGQYVHTFTTFNEPWTFCLGGNGATIDGKAPMLPQYEKTTGTPDEIADFEFKWRYVCGHNVLVAHGLAVRAYRQQFKLKQKGQIGIGLNVAWNEPNSTSNADIAAAQRQRDFDFGWFADPIYKGHYPTSMRVIMGHVLPKFTQVERQLIMNSNDYFGLNHYGTNFMANNPDGFKGDYFVSYESQRFPIIIQNPSTWWLNSAGWGLRKLFHYIQTTYNPKGGIYVLENGWSVDADNANEGKVDTDRVLYYANYTSEMAKAINEDQSDVRGYIGWSAMDNFEWVAGYSERFGVVFTNYNWGDDPNAPINNGVSQQPNATNGAGITFTRKDSSCWFESVWANKKVVDPKGFHCTKSQYNDYFTVVKENDANPALASDEKEVRVKPPVLGKDGGFN